MPIKITCPHCKRGMLVPEHLAGKKGRCKACQQMLTVPPLPATNNTAAEQAKPETPPPAPTDVEAAAAALFADEPKPTEPVEVRTIDLNCPYCDEPIHLPADLAGKRAPCPECKHIIKVPDLVKKDPKDWRTVEVRGPSGARAPEQPTPEGAWGSTTARTVGKQSLVEAGVIPTTAPPRTLWQKVRWPVLAAGLLLLAGASVWMGYGWLQQRAAERGLDEALAFASSADATPTAKAALAMGAGKHYLRAKKADSAEMANKQFGQALNTLRSAPQGNERDALLIDLAPAWIDLSGDQADVDKGLCLPWEKTHGSLQATLREISDAEARLQALRIVGQRLLERGQAGLVLSLVNLIYPAADADKATALAVVGFEFLNANNRPSAERAVEEALRLFPKDKPPPLRAEVVALALALDKKNVPAPGDNEEEKGNVYIGKIEALARQGKWQEARKAMSGDEFDAVVRFRARLAVAAAAVEAKVADTTDMEAAMKAAESGLSDKKELSWSMLRLTSLALQTSLPRERVQSLADKIGSTALRGRAQLAVFRAHLASAQQPVEESVIDKIDAKSLAHSLAAEELARHNTRWGASYASVVQGWQQPRKSFGALGIALGLQDREK